MGCKNENGIQSCADGVKGIQAEVDTQKQTKANGARHRTGARTDTHVRAHGKRERQEEREGANDARGVRLPKSEWEGSRKRGQKTVRAGTKG